MGKLYVLATPIGNLEDMTFRGVHTLQETDVVYAEDTRVAKKLLEHYKIQKQIDRYDEHVHIKVFPKIQELLRNGKTITLMTDAGTPGISDPGSFLIAEIRRMMPDITIIPIPGASAVITLLSVAGVSANQFTFLGYPPQKKGRKTFFEKLKTLEILPCVLYESPHRLHKTFMNVLEVLGEKRKIVVGRELTKHYEEIWCGTVSEAQKHFINEHAKGEFVIVIT